MRWRIENSLLVLAASWACLAVAVRGTKFDVGELPYFLFLWTLPHILASYKPDQGTLRRFESLLYVLFVTDLTFNIGTLISGADILGRDLDEREGILFGRFGGVFAHSFYSGAISLAALLTVISKNRFSWLVVLAAINLLMAGSWRFTLAIVIAVILAIRWRQRSRTEECVFIITISLVIVVGIVLTSGLFEVHWIVNPSNTFRVFAWINSLEKISGSPWFGVGFPKANAISEVGVSFESIDENLIAENWYLSAAITFGIPYTLLFLAGLLAAFWGPAFAKRSVTQAILYPFILIDLVYGDFFGSLLIYFWLWLQLKIKY